MALRLLRLEKSYVLNVENIAPTLVPSVQQSAEPIEPVD
jgi:hypothetical protein